ncbi:hypothetical protein CH063_01437, partial [Colletotrichum higginsianum]
MLGSLVVQTQLVIVQNHHDYVSKWSAREVCFRCLDVCLCLIGLYISPHSMQKYAGLESSFLRD